MPAEGKKRRNTSFIYTQKKRILQKIGLISSPFLSFFLSLFLSFFFQSMASIQPPSSYGTPYCSRIRSMHGHKLPTRPEDAVLSFGIPKDFDNLHHQMGIKSNSWFTYDRKKSYSSTTTSLATTIVSVEDKKINLSKRMNRRSYAANSVKIRQVEVSPSR